MKQRLWAPLVAVGLALVILVPSTFAVGEPGTTLYAQLGFNRFPGGQGAASASLTFLSERDILLGIAIVGPAGTNNAVRVYVDGSCTNPGEWVINRTANAGRNGPFLEVASNSGVNTIQVNQLDVDRIRDELAGNPNETFALMVARVINGQNYRTCTPFRTTPFPPLTTTSATTTSASTRTSTVFSTGTTVRTVTLTSGLTTITLPATTSTQTITTTSTGFSTTTVPLVLITLTLSTPVTTQTIVTTRTTTLGGTTVSTQTGATTFTTTSLFTTPVTTVTTTL